jgi:Ca2+-binding RTX toxin-like protein
MSPNYDDASARGVSRSSRGGCPSVTAWAIAVLAISVVLFPRAADAAIVETNAGGTQIRYLAEPGDANRLSIFTEVVDGFTYYAFDEATTAVDVFSSDCPADVPRHGVRCPANAVVEIQILLGDEDDHLVIDPSASPPGPFGMLGTVIAMGGEGTDSLQGGTGPELLVGGPGNDAPVDKGDGLQWVGLDGGAGDDELIGGPGNDVLQGGAGNDRLDFPQPGSQEDRTAGNDTLDGGPGDDQLNGGPAGDTQDPDILLGGDGTDTADFRDRSAPLKIDLDGTPDDGQSGEHDNVEADVERVIGGSDDDTLVGSDAANFLDGRNGDDRLYGVGGDDTLAGGSC